MGKNTVEQLDQMITDLGDFNDEVLLPVVEGSGDKKWVEVYNEIDHFVGVMIDLISNLTTSPNSDPSGNKHNSSSKH